ncbi:hypothetical protein ACJJIF_20475 [Microbulbifer sp. SSSA002]|uniref:hypothetical protein n=1 Tax=Microbulbifer sp. SSSA002 TaxID=3243376 RepID=UPI00403A3F40
MLGVARRISFSWDGDADLAGTEIEALWIKYFSPVGGIAIRVFARYRPLKFQANTVGNVIDLN